MFYNRKEDMPLYSPLWTGERFPDGRPKVPDSVLERIAKISLEEAWCPLDNAGYRFQFEDRMKRVNQDKKVLVGRALTTTFVPARPDVSDALLDYAHDVQHMEGFFNQWPVQMLEEHDVLVIDMMGKHIEGNPIGGNLSTLISEKTVDGGVIVWGGVRDLEQILEIKNTQTYCLSTDPTPMRNVMSTGINVPCCIGRAVCMPGDVVLGTPEGVLFIPAHMAEEIATLAEKSHIRDTWGFIRIREGVYTAAQVDSEWDADMWEDFYAWFNSAPEADEYRHFNFDKEIAQLRELGYVADDPVFTGDLPNATLKKKVRGNH